MMNRFSAIVFILVLAVGPNRSEEIRPLPEITPHLDQREIMAFSASSSPVWLFSGALLFPFSSPISGTMSIYPEAAGIVALQGRFPYWIVGLGTMPINHPLPVLPGIPVTGGPVSNRYLMLREMEGTNLFLYDFFTGRSRGRWAGEPTKRLIGVAEPLAFFAEADEVVVESLTADKRIAVQAGRIPSFAGLHAQVQSLHLLSEKKLITFYPAANRFAEVELPSPPAADCLFYHQHLIYGSTDRRLIRFFPSQKKTIWSIDLGDLLQFPPIFAQGYIIAITRGDAVYWITPNGTIAGWHSLDSICRYPPLLMRDHVALVLQNNEVLFLNIRDRSQQKIIMDGPADSPLLQIGQSIFLLKRTNPRETRLVRIGNRIGIDLDIQPEHSLRGASVRIAARAVNIDRPRFQFRIEDAAGNLIIKREAKGFPSERVAWIPEQAGRFHLQVKVESPAGVFVADRWIQVSDWTNWGLTILRIFHR